MITYSSGHSGGCPPPPPISSTKEFPFGTILWNPQTDKVRLNTSLYSVLEELGKSDRSIKKSPKTFLNAPLDKILHSRLLKSQGAKSGCKFQKNTAIQFISQFRIWVFLELTRFRQPYWVFYMQAPFTIWIVKLNFKISRSEMFGRKKSWTQFTSGQICSQKSKLLFLSSKLLTRISIVCMGFCQPTRHLNAFFSQENLFLSKNFWEKSLSWYSW